MYNKASSSYISPSFQLHWIEGKNDKSMSGFSLVQMDTKDSLTEPTKKYDSNCLKVLNPFGAPWLYLRFPNTQTNLSNVVVEVSILADFRSELWIEYDSLDEDVDTIPQMPGAFKATEHLTIQKSKQFETLTFHISDGKFSKRINGADFRIVAARPKNTPIFISKVIVKPVLESDTLNSADARLFYKEHAKSIAFEKTDEPLCSIVIPVHNKVEYTIQCLKNLKYNTISPIEVIIVDDGSCREDWKILQKVRGVINIRNKKSLGFAKSCNIGAENAKGEFLVFLNNDTIPKENWLEPMVECAKSTSVVGVVGSKLIYPSTTLIQHAGVGFDRHGLPYHIDKNAYYKKPSVNSDRFMIAVTGACLLTRRTLFNSLCGFDENYRNGYEDIDYCLRASKAGFLTKYCANSELFHYESISEGRSNYEQEVSNRNFFQNRWLSPVNSEVATKTDYSQRKKKTQSTKVIAFYLPQFHRIPENDKWWGKGFTEWKNTQKAKKIFDNHYQPRIPTELGYYDLTSVQVRTQQAKLAYEHGIYAFCYYYYWFNGKKLLEQPIEAMLKSGVPDFPFCICWANENWTRRWDGLESEILIEQNHCEETDILFISEIIEFLADPRYVRINGKPLLIIYRTDLFEDTAQTSERWRELCRNNGIGEIILASCCTFENVRNLPPGFDIAIEFPPRDTSIAPVNKFINSIKKGFKGGIYDYYEYARQQLDEPATPYPRFRSAMLAWDNTARRSLESNIFYGFTPHHYEYWLSCLIDKAPANSSPYEPIVFVNAWNEWAEGCHLEPDQKYERINLEATKRAVNITTSNSSKPKMLHLSRLMETIRASLKRENALYVGANGSSKTIEKAKKAILRHEIENHIYHSLHDFVPSKVALVVHVYYVDVFKEILDFIAGVKSIPIEIYITTVKELESDVSRLITKKGLKNHKIYAFENRGRDVLPFLKIIPEIIEAGHHYLVKVHTKKSLHRKDGHRWRYELYSSLLDDKSMCKGILQLLKRPNIGLLGPDAHLVGMKTYISVNLKNIIRVAKKLGSTEEQFMKGNFIAGTMFMARVEALRPILQLGITDDDFEDEAGQVDGTFAHCLERAFAISANSMGFDVTSFGGVLNTEYDYADSTPITSKEKISNA